MEVGLWDRGWRECSGILTELTEKGFGLMLFLKTFENLDVFSHGRMMCVHFFITSPRFSPSHQVLQSGVGWEGGGCGGEVRALARFFSFGYGCSEQKTVPQDLLYVEQ